MRSDDVRWVSGSNAASEGTVNSLDRRNSKNLNRQAAQSILVSSKIGGWAHAFFELEQNFRGNWKTDLGWRGGILSLEVLDPFYNLF